ncbi:MAG: hypothetical protein CVV02_17275 [Firmicutes bacterium HGW-Firmicutes-7]|nr:MAG: hypothetical protein CVV02_17275 [Firmicutes bacterium HGW-Firmicutes-7]
MYLKKTVFLVTLILMALCFSLSAYATPDDESKDTFFDTFQINQKELAERATKGSLGLYSVSKEGVNKRTDDIEDINNYKVFNLSKGYGKLSVITFSNTKILSGKGEEQTTVGINVFNVSKMGDIVSTDQSIQRIGASGVYNSSIKLDTGDNSVVIAVKKDNLTLYRLFKVNVKEEKTRDYLENLQINLIQPDKSAPAESNTTQGSFIKQVMGSTVDSLTK